MGAGMLAGVGDALKNMGSGLFTKAMKDEEFDRQQAAALAAEERAAQRAIDAEGRAETRAIGAEGRAETRAIGAEGRRMQAEKDLDAHKYKTGQERKTAEGAAFTAKKEEWVGKLSHIKDATMRALQAGYNAAEETGDTARQTHYSGEMAKLRDDARADKQLAISGGQLELSRKQYTDGQALRETQLNAAKLAYDRASAEAKIPVAVERKYKTLATLIENKTKVIDTAIAKGEFNSETGQKLLQEQAALTQEMSDLMAPYMPADKAKKADSVPAMFQPGNKRQTEQGPAPKEKPGLINQPAPVDKAARIGELQNEMRQLNLLINNREQDMPREKADAALRIGQIEAELERLKR